MDIIRLFSNKCSKFIRQTKFFQKNNLFLQIWLFKRANVANFRLPVRWSGFFLFFLLSFLLYHYQIDARSPLNLFPIKFECRRQNFSIFSRRCAHHYLFNNKIQEIFKTFIFPIITISDNYGSFTDVIIKYFFRLNI